MSNKDGQVQISGIDHIVLTVESIEKSIEFYCTILQMPEITFQGGRKAIGCGNQKINLHEKGNEYTPKAIRPMPGSADICLISDTPIEMILERLYQYSIEPIEGPVKRRGAQGDIISIYLQDPDGNLVEIANYM